MVIATGFFDGVHIGHRLVIEQLIDAARSRGDESLVVTFWPHPRTVLQQEARNFRLLTSMQEKVSGRRRRTNISFMTARNSSGVSGVPR